jgi:acetoin utilization protein AcuB
MTGSPHTIGRVQSLTVARRLMREHGIRHLPVLDGGRIVGLLSERDLLLIEALPGVNPTDVRVEEAMVEDVHVVEPDTPLADAIAPMIERKLGSAVVAEGGHVRGILTTLDVLRALADRLEAPE